LVLYQGKPVDVSKLEVVQYETDRQRLFWKTIKSDNGSASHDDGIASFERTFEGTRIIITGRQQFTLPPFWQVFDPKFVPGLKPRLVTHAYQTFFDRTIANFEALVEGRDIRIGRPIDEPPAAAAEQLKPWLERLVQIAMPMLARFAHGQQQREPVGVTDPDGFTHIIPTDKGSIESDPLGTGLSQFVEGLSRAFKRDLLAPALAP
jgi:hypothetical protein